MLVNLHTDWFAPNATLLRAQNNPHDISDDLLEFLPPSALIDNGKGEFVAQDKLDLPSNPTGSGGQKTAVPDKTDTVVTKK